MCEQNNPEAMPFPKWTNGRHPTQAIAMEQTESLVPLHNYGLIRNIGSILLFSPSPFHRLYST